MSSPGTRQSSLIHPALLTRRQGGKGFTLIELLVVIALLAILATTVVFVLNPGQWYREAKDAVRVNDLAAVHGALSDLQATARDLWMGTSTILYVSIPDPTATTSAGTNCAGVGLSAQHLPSGWTYRCPHPSNARNVDGTGWIPIDFTALSFSRISLLSLDPANETSTRLYYTYAASTTARKWHLAAAMQSDKYADEGVNDGGRDPATYELGNDLTLSPFSHGMTAYWSLEETSGSAVDLSKLGNDGTPGAGVTQGVGGKVGKAADFDRTTEIETVNVGNSTHLQYPMSITAWINMRSMPTDYVNWTKQSIVARDSDVINSRVLQFIIQSTGAESAKLEFWAMPQGTTASLETFASNKTFTADDKNKWFFVVVTVTPDRSVTFYIDGSKEGSGSISDGNIPSSTNAPLWIGAAERIPCSYCFDGQIDEVRFYGRALTAAQIKSIYDAEK